MSKLYLYLVLLSCCVLSAEAQTPSQEVTVDAYLRLTFPGRVTHSITQLFTSYQTTINHTTYGGMKLLKTFSTTSENQRGELMDKFAQRSTADQQYDGLTKQVTDSTIGGARGRFIKMIRPDQSKPLFVFTFLTIRGSNLYIVTCSSSKPETGALEDARHFYKHVVFR